MRRIPLVYHEGYDLNFGDHVFPSHKYRLVRARLIREGLAQVEDFIEPEAASEEDLLLVHTPEWVRKLSTGELSYHEILKLEAPYSRATIRAYWLAAGGTILTARLARTSGVALNIGGGFHHAFPGHGEGFCAINDIAVAIRRLQRDRLIERAAVIDCDVHHGNGTAAIFADDPSVFTLSIHQRNNYPAMKPPSTVDIHLEDGATDEEYLERLRGPLEAGLEKHKPQLLVYVAGADPYLDDQLGGLCLSMEGLMARDRLVFEKALEHRVPVATVLAGGYAAQIPHTITIHTNTVRAAMAALDEVGWAP